MTEKKHNVPKAIKQNIKKLSDKKEVPLKELKKEFLKIVEQDPTCQSIDDNNERYRVAMGKLMSQYMLRGQGSDYIFNPFSIGTPYTFKQDGETRKSCKCYGTVRELSDDGQPLDEEIYAAVSLWDDASKNAAKMKLGNQYQMNLSPGKDKTDWGLVLNMNDGMAEKVDDDYDMSNPVDFFTNEIKELEDAKFNTGNADMHISENLVDIKYLKAMTMTPIPDNKNEDREYAGYNATDFEIDENFTIWSPNVEFGEGSELYFIGTLRKDNKERIVMDAHFVIPVNKHSATKLRVEVKPVDEDESGPEEADLGDSESDEDDEDEDELF